MSALPTLHELIGVLPELYQPIFGHPEYDGKANRNVADRLVPILAVHDALTRKLGRPLRVLDMGCAQGWFSLSLARAGAQVVGLDIVPANIHVCNRLLLENRQLDARFKPFEIEKVPDVVPAGQFDLALGLSVLHHLCFHQGKEFVRGFMQALLMKIPNVLLELALATERTELAAALPENPEYIIDHVAHYRVIAHHPHPAGVRPLYFCSTQRILD